MSSSGKKLSTFEIFQAKQNISTDWESKNSADKPVLSTFGFNFFLTFLSSS